MKFKIAILAASLMSGLAMAKTTTASKAVWVARLTEETQCGTGLRPSLGKAVLEIESQDNLAVKFALIDHLKGRMTCMSCGCPAGTYYVAQVGNPSSEQLTALKVKDWEVVSPSDISALPQVVQPEGSYRSLPVEPILR